MKVKAAHMRGTVDTFTAQTAEQHLGDDEKARLVARFNDALTQLLADWSAVHHRPVLVKAAVVSGVDDKRGPRQPGVAVSG